jgi:RNA polymerase sigma-70 factor (ECF subfamily)
VSEDDSAPEWIENLPGDSLHTHARTPEQHLSDRELQAAVDAALLALPENERAVLILYHQEELSYEAVSAALDMPINTVRTHLHRGRKRMAELVHGRLGSAAQPSHGAAAPTTPRYAQHAEAR